MFVVSLHTYIPVENAVVHRSCIVFASLYGKTSYPGNGNLEEENYRFRGKPGGRFSTNFTQTPETVKNSGIITIFGGFA